MDTGGVLATAACVPQLAALLVVQPAAAVEADHAAVEILETTSGEDVGLDTGLVMGKHG